MNDFQRALAYVNERLYQPNALSVTNVVEEVQNADYGAGTFSLGATTVRFRVANITPRKTGQFVAFWQKDAQQKNEAFSYEEAPDLLVINTFSDERFGQFVFPKEVLAAKHVLQTQNTKGKMAMRVYPSWDIPTSKQAIATQKWQLPYFVELTNTASAQQWLKLYERT